MKVVKCLNPNDNPRCTGKVFTKKGLCRSCMLAGRSYEDIYGSEKAQEQIDIRGSSERFKKWHEEGRFKENYFTGNYLHQQGTNLYEYWVDKYGEEIAKQKQAELKEKHRIGAKHFQDPDNQIIYQQKAKETRENRSEERSQEIHDRMSKITSLRTTTPEWKEYQSKKITDLIASGKWQPFNNHKNGNYISKNGSSQKYSSSWELARMMQLDDLGCSWSKHHKIRIPYIDESGINRNYAPDILVDGYFLEEIKPDGLLQYSRNQLKITAGIEYCSKNNLEFRIINDKILGSYIEKALEYHESNRNKT